ncbi:geranylgeranylglycerol-phosphate geranylgeranyltransferase [Candidatus Methanocrinis natronophilus]|uniref:Digeranylgeranylglyceryl phosphate synthase n=1 Tax=Candidatus Methanocrinis natronophilus TaxID=3033396 RepID=A0ABT5X774_9EURY|nr:geranylgeranylglycerol-phosphate geranylgeranyltransferase [Candidatus Methanocrinis natronophilus]MDF0590553.1 geranylgeranylglycerol-phosphate geranylgeranyltransferase [Candidatus Methanocrinis natronophilus]
MLPVYLEIMRPGNCLLAGMAALIGLLVAGGTPEPLTLALVFFAVFAVTGAGNSVNDYFDREIDAVNRPRRPIPSGRISPDRARGWSIVLFAAGCASALFINPLAFAIAAANSILLYLYARSLKVTPFAGNLAVGYLTGSTFLFGGAAGGDVGITVFLFSLAALATLAREIEKDIEDVPGDRASGARTLPIVIGERRSSILAALFVVVAIVLSYLAPLGRAYLVAVTVADLLFLLALVRILQGDAPRAQKMLKAGMTAALVAFMVAAASGLGYL